MTEPSAQALREAYKIRAKVAWLPDDEDLEGAITQCEHFDHDVAQVLDAFAVQAVAAERAKPAPSDLERARTLAITIAKKGAGYDQDEISTIIHCPSAALYISHRDIVAAIAEAVSAERKKLVWTEGLLKETQKALESAVRSAENIRRAERERCAQIAIGFRDDGHQLVTARIMAGAIAKAIRAADDGANR